ncbi:MAG: T9SS type A sorting domain-containing protein [Bacteroidota bacterium]|nr:T9SS type A sorting domain-containing protein [Bacteroidota bacterium]
MNKPLFIKFSLIVIFLCSLSGFSFSQNIIPEWIVKMGDKGWDIVNDMSIDSSGYIYITGSHPKVSTHEKSQSYANNVMPEMYLSKFDTNGNLVWNKNIKSSGTGFGSLIAKTNNNKFLLAGGHLSSASSKGKQFKCLDFFLSLINKNGNEEWSHSFSGTHLDFLSAMIEDTISKEIILAGQFHDTLMMEGKKFICKDKSDAFIFKFDEKGILKKACITTGKGEHKFAALTLDGSSNIIATGTFSRKVCFDKNSSLELTVPGETGAFITKFNSKGDCIFSKLICTGKKILISSLLRTDKSFIMACSFSDILTFKDQKILSRGSDDIVLICFDDQFNTKWIKQIGGNKKDRACNLFPDYPYFVFTGSFTSKVSIDGIELKSTQGSSDIFLLSFDTTGQIKWTRQFGGEGDDYPKCLLLDKKGHVYLSGSFRQTLNINAQQVKSSGDEDVFVTQLENCKELAPKFKHPEKFCDGTELVLNAGTGFLSYNWDNGFCTDQLLKVKESGWHSLELISKNGCMIYDTVQVVELPRPGIFIGNDTTIADTSFLVLNAGKDYLKYAWNNGMQKPINIVRGFDLPYEMNHIWVKGYNADSCNGYAEMYVKVKKTGKNTESDLLLSNCFVYPNPTSGILNVYFTASFDNLDFELYNHAGMLLNSKHFDGYIKNKIITFNLGTNSSGIYSLLIKSSNGFIVKKIVLQ